MVTVLTDICQKAQMCRKDDFTSTKWRQMSVQRIREFPGKALTGGMEVEGQTKDLCFSTVALEV